MPTQPPTDPVATPQVPPNQAATTSSSTLDQQNAANTAQQLQGATVDTAKLLAQVDALQKQVDAMQPIVTELKTHVHMTGSPMPVQNAFMTLSGLQSAPAAEGSDYYLLLLQDPKNFEAEVTAWDANPPLGPTGPPVPPPPPPGGPNEGGQQ
jgi:hypothetical protein